MSSARVPHIIQPNASGAAPSAWIVLDTETIPRQLSEHRWQHDFRLAVAQYWRPERPTKREVMVRLRFTSADSLVDWIVQRVGSKERLGVVAHNMDFDAQVLDIHCRLARRGWRNTRAVIDKGRWVQRWRLGKDKANDGGRSLLWTDLANFYPMPLRELAKWLGMRKWPMPPFDASDEEWFDYCENDVDIEFAALQAWLAFRDTNDLGYFAPTIAGQAFNAYRHRFMDYPIYVHVHDDVIAMESAAYYGGRCHPLFQGSIGPGQYTQLDVNSMYAAVMLDNDYPTRQDSHYGRMSPARLASLLDKGAAIARVQLRTELPAFPCRTDTRIEYPIGEFVTTLATPELRLALATDSITDVQEAITYEAHPIFHSYVSFFWGLRAFAKAQGDTYSAKLAKGFLTSLYGKFGQRLHLSELLATGVGGEDSMWTEYDIDAHETYEYRLIAGRLERASRQVMARDTLLAIPAHVASYARVRLWSLMLRAGLGNVLYVDTDSLIVDHAGIAGLQEEIEQDRLGGLRVIAEARTALIRAPKWYKLGTKVRRSGVKSSAVAIDAESFSQDEFRSMKWALRREFQCAAIVDEVRKSAPYKGKISAIAAGHWLLPPRFVV